MPRNDRSCIRPCRGSNAESEVGANTASSVLSSSPKLGGRWLFQLLDQLLEVLCKPLARQDGRSPASVARAALPFIFLAGAELRIPKTLDRLIELYTATNNPEDLKTWQAERAKCPAATPAEKK
jgi:hypothetical protein